MTMVSQLESSVQAISRSDLEPTSIPRISFSSEFFVNNNEEDHVSLSTLNLDASASCESHGKDREKACNGDRDFEFFSNGSITNSMLTADELFFEGKLLPFWQMEQTEKLNKITLTPKGQVEGDHQKELNNKGDQECRVSWVMDDDPSPRPPTCTVLWKELLRLRKHRASSLSSSTSTSTSTSTSASSSRSSSRSSTSSSSVNMEAMEEGKESSKERFWNKEKHVKRLKKGLERTRSASFRMRPMVSVPICTHAKNRALSPLLYLKKGNV